MASTIDQFDFRKLSVPERILLAQKIWDSVAAEGQPIELTDAQKAELKRRMDDYEKSPESFPTWEEVKARLQSQKP